jgi:hypothetical protein
MAFAGLLAGLCDDFLSATIVALTSSAGERASVAELFEGFKKPLPFADRETEAGLKVLADEGAMYVDEAKLLSDSDTEAFSARLLPLLLLFAALAELFDRIRIEAVVPDEVDGTDASPLALEDVVGLVADGYSFEELAVRLGEVNRGEAEVDVFCC